MAAAIEGTDPSQIIVMMYKTPYKCIVTGYECVEMLPLILEFVLLSELVIGVNQKNWCFKKRKAFEGLSEDHKNADVAKKEVLMGVAILQINLATPQSQIPKSHLRQVYCSSAIHKVNMKPMQ